MIINSFYSHRGQVHPLEVELKLMPGLPVLQVLGLADTSLKESSLRIKTALKHQGFQWPKAKQVVVNLRPTHIKKHSQGLELAIACALLWETGQAPKPKNLEKTFIYGELGLEGEVLPPNDLETIRQYLTEESVFYGSRDGKIGHVKKMGLKSLRDLEDQCLMEDSDVTDFEVPEHLSPEIYFSEEQARLLSLSALTGCSTLLAGPPGSGKTTFAESLYHLFPPLKLSEFLNLRSHHLQLGQDLKGRPLVSPHHSTPVMSLIGGGSEVFPGELAKAHGGLLILDEFLLFPSRVIEALREPLVSKKFVISRRGKTAEWPADFQFVATTNLCPCGKLSEDRSFFCSYTIRRCRSVLEKLSGPILDRFELIVLFKPYYMQKKSEKKISLVEIRERVVEARALKEEFAYEEDLKIPEVYSLLHSRRREVALKKLALGLALLDGRSEVGDLHWTEAFLLSQKPIEQIESFF